MYIYMCICMCVCLHQQLEDEPRTEQEADPVLPPIGVDPVAPGDREHVHEARTVDEEDLRLQAGRQGL